MTLLDWARSFPDCFFELPEFCIFTDPKDTNIRNNLRDAKTWEPKGTEVILREFQGETLVDAGAHWGYYSLLMAKRANRIYAFEAHPLTFRYLQLNVLLNGFRNISAFPLVLWSSSNLFAETQISLPGSNSGGNRVSGVGKDGIIQTMKLDDIFLPTEVDFIKVDCEGSDTEVLKGAEKILRDGHPKLLIEGPPKEFLEDLDYSVIQDCGSGCGPLSLWVKK